MASTCPEAKIAVWRLRVLEAVRNRKITLLKKYVLMGDKSVQAMNSAGIKDFMVF